jgi:hypothetical protein
MRLLGTSTKKETINRALHEVVQRQRRIEASIELGDAPHDTRALFFKPDGELVAIGDTTVGIWTMRADVAAAAVCRLPRADLISQAQWDSYFPGVTVPMPCGDHHG